jgi:hypothetical protein
MKKFINIILSLLLTSSIFTQLLLADSEEQKRKTDTKEDTYYSNVSVIPLSGMIDGGLHNSLERRADIAKKSGSDPILFGTVFDK